MAKPRASSVDELRHYVSLEARAQAAAGGASGTTLSESFTVTTHVWAKIEGIPGGRYVAGQGQVEPVATHICTILHRAANDFDHVRDSDGTLYRVAGRAYDPDGGQLWLEMQLEELPS